MLDTVIRNGRIVDGTGNPWYKADIGIAEGRIKTISQASHLDGHAIIDATNRFVAPGFIDIHGHSDFVLLADPLCEYKVRQGITTEVNGNCGISAGPFHAIWSDFLHSNMMDGKVQVTWKSLGEYLDVISSVPHALNIVSLVGYNTVRASVINLQSQLGLDEKKGIHRVIEQSLTAGGFGLSTGLVYEAGSLATTEEIIEACRIVANHGAVYASHCRGLRETFVQSTIEALEIGRSAGVGVHISHHMPQYGGWGKCRVTLPLIEEARSQGIDVTLDIHLDTVGATGILSTLPSWCKDGGFDALARRLADQETRKRIKMEMKAFNGPGTSGYIRHGRWDLMHLVSCQTNTDLLGMTFAEIGQREKKSPHDAFLDLLLEEKGNAQVAGFYTPKEDIEMILQSPLCSVGTDAMSPLEQAVPPPRTYGTFPRLLGEYVREKKVISLEEAIRKSTSANARRFGIYDRGVISEGYWADITIFNIDAAGTTISDEDFLKGKAYVDPYPQGIDYVMVSGQIVLNEGRVTGVLPGKVLRRQ